MKDEIKIQFAGYGFLAAMVLNVVCAFLPIQFPNYTTIIIFSQVIIALPFICLFIITKLNAKEGEKVTYANTVNMKKIKPVTVLLTIILGFFLQPVLSFFNALSLVFTTSTTTATMSQLTKEVPFLAAAFLMAALPAFMEESVYRGFLYQPLRKANPWKAVVLTGFCFGLMHGNLNQFMYAFVMGMVFALINEGTGSILSSMIIHLESNLISVVTLYLMPWLYGTMQELYAFLAEHQEESPEFVRDMQLLEETFGDLTLSAEEWFNQLLSQSANAHMSLGTVIAGSLPSAIVFGFVSFLLFRTICRQCGTWNNFRHVFLGAENSIVEAETKSTYGTEKEIPEEKEKGTPGLRVLTIPMMVAIAIGIMFMYVYETLKLLPQ